MITTAEEERKLSYRAKITSLREKHCCLMRNSTERQRELIRKVLPDLIERGFCKQAQDMSNVPDKRKQTININNYD